MDYRYINHKRCCPSCYSKNLQAITDISVNCLYCDAASSNDTLLTEGEAQQDLMQRGYHRFIPNLLDCWQGDKGLTTENLDSLAREEKELEINTLKTRVANDITELKQKIGLFSAIDFVSSLIGKVKPPMQ